MTATVPETAQVRCPRCRKPVDVTAITTSPAAMCPLCAGEFEAVRFIAPVRATAVAQMAEARIDAAQPCATHPGNVAVTTCQRCGSFICALCRIDVDNRTLCPVCFERLSSEGSLESTRTTFRDFPGLAGLSATAGCVLSFFAIVLGPLAIYYGVKALRQKREMGEEDGFAGIWLAILIGVAEVGVGLFLVGSLIVGMMKR
jgi:hypothetical protein